MNLPNNFWSTTIHLVFLVLNFNIQTISMMVLFLQNVFLLPLSSYPLQMLLVEQVWLLAGEFNL